MKKFALFVQFMLASLFGFAAEPLRTDFNGTDYKAHPIVWSLLCDAHSNWWMANNEGVLHYDGANWQLLKTPGPVRQMAFNAKGDLFVACEADFGVLQYQNNTFKYASFKNQLGDALAKSKGEKRVFILDDMIYFLSDENLFKLSENASGYDIKVINLGPISGSFVWNQKLYINLLNKGLGVFTNMRWTPQPNGETFRGLNIVGAATHRNNILIATNYNGIYTYDGSKANRLGADLNNFALKGVCAISTSKEGKIAIGSFSNGAMLFESNGKAIQNLNLPSNEIYALSFDPTDNIWVGHRKGLSHIKTALPIQCYPSVSHIGNITDITSVEQQLFIASTTGCYIFDPNNASLKPVLNGECWQICPPFVATTDGLMNLNGKLLLKDEPILYVQKSRINKQRYFALGAESVYVIDGEINPQISKLPGLLAMPNSIFENQDNSYWIGTSHGGLLLLNAKDKPVIPEELSANEVIIRIIQGEPVFQSPLGVFMLKNKQFLKDQNLSDLLCDCKSKTVNIVEPWYAYSANKLFAFEKSKTMDLPVSSCISGRPTAAALFRNLLWLAMEEKLYAVNNQNLSENGIEPGISHIKNNRGISIYEAGTSAPADAIKINYEDHSLLIEFGLPSLLNPAKNLYRYRLDASDNWSEWSDKSFISLNQLSPGKYSLELEAKSAAGNMMKGQPFTFVILAPWYLSIYAYLLYACSFILLLMGLIRLNSKALITKNRKLEHLVGERTKQLEQNNEELKIEKKKSDDLLLNILPEEIAEELKTKGHSDAKYYEQVSVLFTDFVNFTGISAQLNPQELVQEIHANFTAFDAIMEKHGIEKIKTIGDAYLAVCGLPNKQINHAERITLAALEIQDFMKVNQGKFQIRIGIHTGPVVAGIVGVKKYAYDIWGDTVNTAARMEQNSEAGKINISGATHDLIKDSFNFESRGMINAKNKGQIEMYFVLGSK